MNWQISLIHLDNETYTIRVLRLERIKSLITIFNRKQLIITYDMIIQAKIRDILALNNVDYTINPVMFAYDSSKAEYKIYVHKKDYEQACYLIKDVFR